MQCQLARYQSPSRSTISPLLPTLFLEQRSPLPRRRRLAGIAAGRITPAGRAGNADAGHPATHPAIDAAPAPSAQRALLAAGVGLDHDDGLGAALDHAALAEPPELHAHQRVQRQHARRPQEERRRQRHPLRPVGAVGAGPAAAAVRPEAAPRAGVGEQRGRVEQVAGEGGGEQRRREAGGRAPRVVLEQLRDTRPQVAQRRQPREGLADGFAGGFRWRWGVRGGGERVRDARVRGERRGGGALR